MATTTRRLLGTLLGLSCMLLVCGGCKTYLERETPMTTASQPVPPAAPVEGSQPIAPSGVTGAAPRASATSPYLGQPLSTSPQPQTEEAYAGSLERFRKAYADANAPRIAVYFNRALSDEVREWITPARAVIAGKGQSVAVGEGPTVVTPSGTVLEGGATVKAEGSTDTQRGVTGYTQVHTEEPQRPSPEELWTWSFEDHFLQPFLKAGAKMVDRATTLRLVASTKSQDATYIVPVKQVEMKALTGYADVLVEILVTRDHASPSGYAFRATAKQTRTGILMGSVTKTGRDPRYERPGEVIATPSGYELRKGSAPLILETVSQELAVDLMNSMATAWQNQPR